MRWSNYFLPTLREDPKDAEAISHKLMVRAGLIRRLGSGAYSYLPFGLRALQKVISIVREEMNRAGAQELLLPALHPVELWKTTGRYDALGDVLIRFKDRTGKEIALGPTHEEVITDLIKELRSYKQLPIIAYQIQTKFRDEPRPRCGVIRSKEFLMKDAYSFDTDAVGLSRSYKAMYEAYKRIFSRSGLSVMSCEADPGLMGGDVSHEFMAPSQNGEDIVVRCSNCDYAANLEAAKCQAEENGSPIAKEQKPMEAVKTPGKHTVEEVSRFLNVPASKLIKTLLYDVDGGHAAVLVRGDHDANEAKIARCLKTAHLKLSNAQTIERLSGAPIGFSGPVNLSGIKLLSDHAVMSVVNGVTGANKDQTHLINVNPGRDFKPDVTSDLRMVSEGDTCPKCTKALKFVRAIEVGHVFKLGTKYSEALGAIVQDEEGSLKPMIMGCYGIGVNRIVAASIEQHHDEDGIIWPLAIAPFHVLISVLETNNAELSRVGSDIYEELSASGFDVLLDDREQSPSSKLKDADLIGIPIQVIIGKSWKKDQTVEVCLRQTKTRQAMKRSDLVGSVHEFLDKASSVQ